MVQTEQVHRPDRVLVYSPGVPGEFERSWAHSEVSEKSSDGVDKAQKDIKMTDKQKRQRGAGKEIDKEKEQDKEKTPKIKSDLDLAAMRAQRTKDAFANTMSSAGTLRNNIKNNT